MELVFIVPSGIEILTAEVLRNAIFFVQAKLYFFDWTTTNKTNKTKRQYLWIPQLQLQDK